MAAGTMCGNKTIGFFLIISKDEPNTSTALNSTFSGVGGGALAVDSPQEGQVALSSGVSLPHLGQNGKAHQ